MHRCCSIHPTSLFSILTLTLTLTQHPNQEGLCAPHHPSRLAVGAV
jgi:hypothetical protein